MNIVINGLMIEHVIVLIYLCRYGDIALIEKHINEHKDYVPAGEIIYFSWKYSLHSYGKKWINNFSSIDSPSR